MLHSRLKMISANDFTFNTANEIHHIISRLVIPETINWLPDDRASTESF